ncbi:MAG: hypothetical protein K2H01_07995 [Ruminococcus sp.]|nr:hypothetical protein [Ruminococcus sp.]
MSYELINRITVKKDGVYVSSKSNNDTAPYYSHRIDFLSKIYETEGQKGLDRAIFKLFYYNAAFRGTHKSVERYRRVINSPDGYALYEKYVKTTNERFYALSKEDQHNVDFSSSEEAKWYREFEKKQADILYAKLADLCEILNVSNQL